MPDAVAPCAATAVLGAGFTGYLAYAKATAPESSCGCSARAEGPIGVPAFVRAGLVVAGGVLAATADRPWWSELSRRPAVGGAVLALALAGLAALTADVDRFVRVPLRRARLRLFGHPLPPAGGAGERVPVAASVELLERSLAWQAARPVVRSALLDHWEDEGWRVLLYAGAYRDARGTHPASVLFALDRTLTVDSAPAPAVRVSVIDELTGEVVPSAVAAPARRAPLPLAT